MKASTKAPGAKKKPASDLEAYALDGLEEEHAFRRPVAPPVSKNPIIAAIQLCLWRRGEAHMTALTGHKYKPGQMRALIARVFDDDAIRELGSLMTEALITGNTDFVETVKRAIKEADAVFHRNREKQLLDSFASFVWNLPEPLPENAKIRMRFEKKKNNGKSLEEHQWQRLRKALNLPKDKGGRPKKP